LKSSLKCSRGRRVIVSEPSTPPGPKSVRFKDTDGELESVCFFRTTGRPYSISHPRSHSDTETETDNTDGASTTQRGRTTFTLAEVSPIPSPQTPPESHVHLESIALLPARPPFLRGIVRVRNLAFEKSVSVRFTTDGWATVSEAHARYVGPAGTGDWDLFAFTIPLEAPPLQQPRTLLLAVHYAVPGTGEWWDNNGGADFRVVLA
ncbi:putative phosphatase regulatory subunit-domain-containing protein, partial [Lactarius sanguifluus]